MTTGTSPRRQPFTVSLVVDEADGLLSARPGLERDKELLGSATDALSAAAAEIGFAEQVRRIDDRRRDRDAPLFLMVVGEGNFGKSSLVNALLGREVAPVGRIPTTRILDLYETGHSGGGATLYRRSMPDPVRASREEALRARKEVERQASTDGPESDAGDLYQIRWFVDGDWPPTALVLVDTPGIAQVRSVFEKLRYKATLYGSQGIEAAEEHPFEHYYYRADAVLWCIRAGKVDSADSLAALSAVAEQQKPVLGILTCMDEVPAGQRQEVVTAARRNFAPFIEEFVPVCTKGAPEMVESSIAALRSVVWSQLLGDQDERKRIADVRFLGDEVTTLAANLRGLVDGYASALIAREAASGRVANYVDQARGLEPEITRVIRHAERRARTSTEELLEKGMDADDFQNAIRHVIDVEDLKKCLAKIAGEFDDSVNRVGALLEASLTWPTIAIRREEQSASTEVEARPRPTLAHISAISTAVELEMSDGQQFFNDIKRIFSKNMANRELRQRAEERFASILNRVEAEQHAQMERNLVELLPVLSATIDWSFSVAYGGQAEVVGMRIARMFLGACDVADKIDLVVQEDPDVGGILAIAIQELRNTINALEFRAVQILDSSVFVRILQLPTIDVSIWIQLLVHLAQNGSQKARKILRNLISRRVQPAHSIDRPALLASLSDEGLAVQMITCIPLNEARQSLSISELSTVASNQHAGVRRHAVQLLLPNLESNEMVAEALLDADEPAVRARAEQVLLRPFKQEAFSIKTRLASVHKDFPVSNLDAWVLKRDVVARSAEVWLGSIPDRFRSSLGKQVDLITRLLASATDRAEVLAGISWASEVEARDHAERIRKKWNTLYFGAFGLCASFLVIFRVTVNYPASTNEYFKFELPFCLAMMAATVVSDVNRGRVGDPESWRKYYKGPMNGAENNDYLPNGDALGDRLREQRLDSLIAGTDTPPSTWISMATGSLLLVGIIQLCFDFGTTNVATRMPATSIGRTPTTGVVAGSTTSAPTPTTTAPTPLHSDPRATPDPMVSRTSGSSPPVSLESPAAGSGGVTGNIALSPAIEGNLEAAMNKYASSAVSQAGGTPGSFYTSIDRTLGATYGPFYSYDEATDTYWAAGSFQGCIPPFLGSALNAFCEPYAVLSRSAAGEWMPDLVGLGPPGTYHDFVCSTSPPATVLALWGWNAGCTPRSH